MTALRPPMSMDTVLTTTRGQPVTARDVVTQLKLKGQFRTAICDIIEARVIAASCAAYGLEVGAEALAEGCARQRAIQGLGDDRRFATWLQLNGVTAEQWAEQVRLTMLRDLLKGHVVTDAIVERHFETQRERLVSVSLGRMVVHSEKAAAGIRKKLTANPADFEEMCRSCSEDAATRAAGGFIGVVKRGMLPPAIESEVFAAANGSVLGPFHEPAGISLYKVYCRDEAELGGRLREMLREQIFAEWLRHEVHIMPA